MLMTGQKEEYRGFLSGFTLKCIAMVTMLIDHIGYVLFPGYVIFRIIGRLAFPIYCFLLVEGAVHTSNWKKYLGRLFLFALISEIPFNLAIGGSVWYPEAQNVLFTLMLGLLAIRLLQEPLNRKNQSLDAGHGEISHSGRNQTLITGIRVALVLALVLLAEFARTDYGAGGVIFILIFYVFRSQQLLKSAVFAAAVAFLYGGIENFAILSLVPILCYNEGKGSFPLPKHSKAEFGFPDKRGPGAWKYFFYVFYPAHLLLLYLLAAYVFRGAVVY